MKTLIGERNETASFFIKKRGTRAKGASLESVNCSIAVVSFLVAGIAHCATDGCATEAANGRSFQSTA